MTNSNKRNMVLRVCWLMAVCPSIKVWLRIVWHNFSWIYTLNSRWF